MMVIMIDERSVSDVTGRVMSLEQRMRGLQGRVSALEARVSAGKDDKGVGDAIDDIEFVAAFTDDKGPGDIVSRLEAVERSLNIKPKPAAGPDTLDVSGIVGGVALIGAGLLLSLGSFDLLKNPLLAFGTGIALLVGAGARALKRGRQGK